MTTLGLISPYLPVLVYSHYGTTGSACQHTPLRYLLSISVYLCVYLSANGCLIIYLSICLTIYLFMYLSIYISVYLTYPITLYYFLNFSFIFFTEYNLFGFFHMSINSFLGRQPSKMYLVTYLNILLFSFYTSHQGFYSY